MPFPTKTGKSGTSQKRNSLSDPVNNITYRVLLAQTVSLGNAPRESPSTNKFVILMLSFEKAEVKHHANIIIFDSIGYISHNMVVHLFGH